MSQLGQLLEIANEIYGLDLKVKILEAENDISGGTAGPIDLAAGLKSVVVKYRLDFDNTEYVMKPTTRTKCVKSFDQNSFPLTIKLHVVCTNQRFTITKPKKCKSLDGETISHSSSSISIEFEARDDRDAVGAFPIR